ncbi:DgyrCDS11242 [Dimorphilus gyrociliatus]|uniref:HEAT repeat-containing protein 6 n=1 Tax=Dimorphilus gyrociliatus TaxID=2664684 RepID=A0A7I8W2N7_9ANNE|nr:DgyrCDS11242 [Dimorphilus gyrociliatus]
MSSPAKSHYQPAHDGQFSFKDLCDRMLRMKVDQNVSTYHLHEIFNEILSMNYKSFTFQRVNTLTSFINNGIKLVKLNEHHLVNKFCEAIYKVGWDLDEVKLVDLQIDQVINWFLNAIEQSPRWVTGKILFSFSVILNKQCYDASPKICAALISEYGFLTTFLSMTKDIEMATGVAACLKSFFRFDADMQEDMNIDCRTIRYVFAKLLHCLAIEIPRMTSDQLKHLRMVTYTLHLLQSLYKLGYFWHKEEVCQILRRFCVLNPSVDFKYIDIRATIDKLYSLNDENYVKLQSVRAKRSKSGKKKKKPETTQLKAYNVQSKINWNKFSYEFKFLSNEEEQVISEDAMRIINIPIPSKCESVHDEVRILALKTLPVALSYLDLSESFDLAVSMLSLNQKFKQQKSILVFCFEATDLHSRVRTEAIEFITAVIRKCKDILSNIHDNVLKPLTITCSSMAPKAFELFINIHQLLTYIIATETNCNVVTEALKSFETLLEIVPYSRVRPKLFYDIIQMAMHCLNCNDITLRIGAYKVIAACLSVGRDSNGINKHVAFVLLSKASMLFKGSVKPLCIVEPTVNKGGALLMVDVHDSREDVEEDVFHHGKLYDFLMQGESVINQNVLYEKVKLGNCWLLSLVFRILSAKLFDLQDVAYTTVEGFHGLVENEEWVYKGKRLVSVVEVIEDDSLRCHGLKLWTEFVTAESVLNAEESLLPKSLVYIMWSEMIEKCLLTCIAAQQSSVVTASANALSQISQSVFDLFRSEKGPILYSIVTSAANSILTSKSIDDNCTAAVFKTAGTFAKFQCTRQEYGFIDDVVRLVANIVGRHSKKNDELKMVMQRCAWLLSNVLGQISSTPYKDVAVEFESSFFSRVLSIVIVMCSSVDEKVCSNAARSLSYFIKLIPQNWHNEKKVDEVNDLFGKGMEKVNREENLRQAVNYLISFSKKKALKIVWNATLALGLVLKYSPLPLGALKNEIIVQLVKLVACHTNYKVRMHACSALRYIPSIEYMEEIFNEVVLKAFEGVEILAAEAPYEKYSDHLKTELTRTILHFLALCSMKELVSLFDKLDENRLELMRNFLAPRWAEFRKDLVIFKIRTGSKAIETEAEVKHYQNAIKVPEATEEWQTTEGKIELRVEDTLADLHGAGMEKLRTGFIGRNLVQYLVENNLAHEIGVVDKTPPQMAYLCKRSAEAFRDDRVHFSHANLINPASVQKAFDTCRKGNYEYVVNCAAETKHGHNDAVYKEGIYKLSLNCSKESAKRNVKKYIELSTCRIFDSEKPCNETHKADFPWTERDKQKLLAESKIKETPELNWIILRLVNVYGPGDICSFLPKILAGAVYKYLERKMQILWTGHLKTNTVHVKDACKAIWHLCERVPPRNVFHLADKGSTNQAVLASIVSEIFDIECEFVGSLLSKVAKSNLSDLIREMNESHLGAWINICEPEKITTPLSPFLAEEEVYDRNLSVDGSKIEGTGFQYDYPKISTSLIREVIEEYIDEKRFPKSIILR